MYDPSPDDLIGAVFGETYCVERWIATGGFGVVYEASHARLPNKRYALKVLHASIASNEEVRARFRREAEIACRLDHPHIVEVLDFNETADGRPYLVMELLSGESFEERLLAGRQPREAVLVILQQVAAALAAAHAQGVVHRDMKPDNIFLAYTGDGGETVKVIDFGISKLRESRTLVTRDHAVMGTVDYMSPEQAMGTVGDIDALTDVFALGIIASQALTGELPFRATTLPRVLHKICNDEPDLGQLEPSIAAVLRRALAKNKTQRYRDVEVFVAELVAAVRNAGTGGRAEDGGEAAPPRGATESESEEPAAAPTVAQDPPHLGTLMGSPSLLDALAAPPKGAEQAAKEVAPTAAVPRSVHDTARATTLRTAVGEVDFVPRRRLVPGLALGVLLLAIIGGGLFVFRSRGQHDAAPPGNANSRLGSAAATPRPDARIRMDSPPAVALSQVPTSRPTGRPAAKAPSRQRRVDAPRRVRPKRRWRGAGRVRIKMDPLPPSLDAKPSPKRRRAPKALGDDLPATL